MMHCRNMYMLITLSAAALAVSACNEDTKKIQPPGGRYVGSNEGAGPDGTV
jgi:hypothetical protein